MSSWDEIKRLAADLQRTQLLSTSQRLSERNCIEIVAKLVELKLIEVVHTTNGKEYITPEQISREIKDELIVHNGRIGLPELSQQLSVDFSHVEARATKLAREDKCVHLVNGYLVSREYLDNLAEEVNDKLQRSGEVNIGDLSTQYNLPTEFLEKEFYRRLGSLISAEPDPDNARTLFTSALVARTRARVLGALSAVTRPTTVLQLLQQHNIKEQLFFNVAAELISCGRVRGHLIGGRHAVRAVFVPECHSAAQQEYLDQQLRQHGFLDFDALKLAGVSDAESMVRRRYKDRQLTYLSSCAIGQPIVEQIQSYIEQTVDETSFIDLLPMMPDCLSPQHVQQLIQQLPASAAVSADSWRLLATSADAAGQDSVCVVSTELLQRLQQPLQDMMPSRAREAIASGLVSAKTNAKHSSSRQPAVHSSAGSSYTAPSAGTLASASAATAAAAGLAGGYDGEKGKKRGVGGAGSQGRESRTRAVKNKYQRRMAAAAEMQQLDKQHGTDDGSGEDQDLSGSHGVVFMSIDELQSVLGSCESLEDACDQLVLEIAKCLFRPLNEQYMRVVSEMQQSIVCDESHTRRQNFSVFQDKVLCLCTNVRLFEKGAHEFLDDTRTQLLRYLLRTVCTELVSELCVESATQHCPGDALDSSTLSAQARAKIIDQLPSDVAAPLAALQRSLTPATEVNDPLEPFNKCLPSALAACGVHVHKVDRKKDKAQSQQICDGVLKQLSSVDCVDPALCLHLTCLILFNTHTGHVLHASGKFVPALVARLARDLAPQTHTTLLQCQELVMKQLKLARSADQLEQLESVRLQLSSQLVPQLKQLTAATRPSSS